MKGVVKFAILESWRPQSAVQFPCIVAPALPISSLGRGRRRRDVTRCLLRVSCWHVSVLCPKSLFCADLIYLYLISYLYSVLNNVWKFRENKSRRRNKVQSVKVVYSLFILGIRVSLFIFCGLSAELLNAEAAGTRS
jgi:hypothetical protein